MPSQFPLPPELPRHELHRGPYYVAAAIREQTETIAIAIDGKIVALSVTVADQATRLAGVEATITGLAATIEALSKALDSAVSRLARVETAFDAIVDKVAALERKVTIDDDDEDTLDWCDAATGRINEQHPIGACFHQIGVTTTEPLKQNSQPVKVVASTLYARMKETCGERLSEIDLSEAKICDYVRLARKKSRN